MSDTTVAEISSWPRGADGGVLWGDHAPGILFGRLARQRPVWEPMVVTTLRRYVRRGAPASLLDRLSGSTGNWRYLNDRWRLDPRRLAPTTVAVEPVTYVEPLEVTLSPAERQLALLQLIGDLARAGEVFPPLGDLARLLRCGADDIADDLDWLRADGLIGFRRYEISGVPSHRVIRLVGTDLATAEPPRRPRGRPPA